MESYKHTDAAPAYAQSDIDAAEEFYRLHPPVDINLLNGDNELGVEEYYYDPIKQINAYFADMVKLSLGAITYLAEVKKCPVGYRSPYEHPFRAKHWKFHLASWAVEENREDILDWLHAYNLFQFSLDGENRIDYFSRLPFHGNDPGIDQGRRSIFYIAFHRAIFGSPPESLETSLLAKLFEKYSTVQPGQLVREILEVLKEYRPFSNKPDLDNLLAYMTCFYDGFNHQERLALLEDTYVKNHYFFTTTKNSGKIKGLLDLANRCLKDAFQPEQMKDAFQSEQPKDVSELDHLENVFQLKTPKAVYERLSLLVTVMRSELERRLYQLAHRGIEKIPATPFLFWNHASNSKDSAPGVTSVADDSAPKITS